MKKFHRVTCDLVLLFYFLVGNYSTVYAAANEGICALTNQYTCPTACGGTVSDCLECDGYLNTGKRITDTMKHFS